MKLPSFAFRENLVVPDEPKQPPLPKGVRALELLQMTYRGEVKPSAQQMRAAIESLPYENPRVSAVALGYLSREDFASALDRAIDRSNGARVLKLIEATSDRQ